MNSGIAGDGCTGGKVGGNRKQKEQRKTLIKLGSQFLSFLAFIVVTGTPYKVRYLRTANTWLRWSGGRQSFVMGARQCDITTRVSVQGNVCMYTDSKWNQIQIRYSQKCEKEVHCIRTYRGTRAILAGCLVARNGSCLFILFYLIPTWSILVWTCNYRFHLLSGCNR